ncbi:hypothetical protein Asulf_01045 [Archaeoglobus sulfaticallidus PM70-1]|uniref:Uncharacterized protein n=1 Tax=Archaeoglobus sulfaticallidus PM70-1 TaxID=387631 RepID=N0BKL7_9EURY|nr:hypothetical protein [Archaeoglobus sulfaticallidus]AGK61046.1 hypothetical protein Asulf_01045 [Archaeoglobus sulfaticallidus PM70-1]
MDVDDIITLFLAIWVVILILAVKTVDVFITLLLIGLLVVAEVGGSFIKPETKEMLKPSIYFLLFLFMIIVAKKVIEVLS